MSLNTETMITLTKLAVLQLLRLRVSWKRRAALDIALRLSVFLLSVCYFIPCMTDTDDVALLEMQVAVSLCPT